MTPVGINRVGHISSSSFLPPIYPSPYLSLLPSFLSYSFYFFLPFFLFFYVCVSLSPLSLPSLSPFSLPSSSSFFYVCPPSICVSPFSLPLLSLSLLSPILLLLLFLCLYVYFYFLPYFLFLDRFGDRLSF